MDRPEGMFDNAEKCSAGENIIEDIDLSEYDGECLKRDVLCIEIRGERIPLWRAIEKLLWVKDQDTHRLVPFRMRWAQRYLYRELVRQVITGKPMRLDVLKARQLGLSTVIAAIFFLLAMYKPHTRWCVMADIKEHASNIFEMYQTFYEHLDDSLPNAREIHEYEHETGKRHPLSIRPELSKKRSGTMMSTKDNDSKIEVIVAGDTAGRSASYTGVHSSETAFQKDLLKTNVSLFSTVSVNDRDSIIIIETTANGYNDYKQRWDNDVSGKTSFTPVFINWFKHPDYRIRCESVPQMDAWIYEKWEKHPEITKEQIAWYWSRYCDGYTEALMKQEFPFDPDDSFISSGKSVFDITKLVDRKNYLISRGKYYKTGHFRYKARYSPDGSTIEMTDVDFDETDSGYWRIYRKPEPNRHYVIICDPSKGMNYDYSAIQIIEQNTGVQVACYDAKEDIDEVAKQLYCGGRYYNYALLSCENNTGFTVLDLIVKMKYPNVYVDQQPVYNDFTQTYSRRFGHTVTLANRQAMIDSFVIAFRQNPEIINDIPTLLEMEAFQVVQKKSSSGEQTFKAMANGANSHDDRVMSYAPFWTIRTQQNFDFEKRAETEKPRLISDMDDYAYYLMMKHKQDKKKQRGKVQNTLGIRW